MNSVSILSWGVVAMYKIVKHQKHFAFFSASVSWRWTKVPSDGPGNCPLFLCVISLPSQNFWSSGAGNCQAQISGRVSCWLLAVCKCVKSSCWPSSWNLWSRPSHILGVEEVEAVCYVNVDVTFSHFTEVMLAHLLFGQHCPLESILKNGLLGSDWAS